MSPPAIANSSSPYLATFDPLIEKVIGSVPITIATWAAALPCAFSF